MYEYIKLEPKWLFPGDRVNKLIYPAKLTYTIALHSTYQRRVMMLFARLPGELRITHRLPGEQVLVYPAAG